MNVKETTHAHQAKSAKIYLDHTAVMRYQGVYLGTRGLMACVKIKMNV